VSRLCENWGESDREGRIDNAAADTLSRRGATCAPSPRPMIDPGGSKLGRGRFACGPAASPPQLCFSLSWGLIVCGSGAHLWVAMHLEPWRHSTDLPWLRAACKSMSRAQEHLALLKQRGG